jgi:hypothetical protein
VVRTPTCPRCGAPRDEDEPQALARCAYCGALLGAPAASSRPLQARPRLDGVAARQSASRSLTTRNASAEIGEPRLIFYPFALERSTRRPLRALAPLPPALESGWRASGADLVYDDPGEADDALCLGASRVPVAEDPAPGTEIVFYPIFRVPVEVDGAADAVWVDAVDGQATAPWRSGSDEPADRSALTRWIAPALAVGVASGLLLPFPVSLVPIGGAAAWAWQRAGRP